MREYERHGETIDYAAIVKKLHETGLAGFGNGLTETENKTLLSSPYISEVVGLVIKGLRNLRKE